MQRQDEADDDLCIPSDDDQGSTALLSLTSASWPVVFDPFLHMSPVRKSGSARGSSGAVTTSSLPIAATICYQVSTAVNDLFTQDSASDYGDPTSNIYATPAASIETDVFAGLIEQETLSDRTDLSHSVRRWIESLPLPTEQSKAESDPFAVQGGIQPYTLTTPPLRTHHQLIPITMTSGTRDRLGASPGSSCADVLGDDVRILRGQRQTLTQHAIPTPTIPAFALQHRQSIAPPHINRRRAQSDLRPDLHITTVPNWSAAWQDALQDIYAAATRPRSSTAPSPAYRPGFLYDTWPEEQDVQVDGSLGPPASDQVTRRFTRTRESTAQAPAITVVPVEKDIAVDHSAVPSTPTFGPIDPQSEGLLSTPFSDALGDLPLRPEEASTCEFARPHRRCSSNPGLGIVGVTCDEDTGRRPRGATWSGRDFDDRSGANFHHTP